MDSMVDHYPDVLRQMEAEALLYPSVQALLEEKKISENNTNATIKPRHHNRQAPFSPSMYGGSTPFTCNSPVSPLSPLFSASLFSVALAVAQPQTSPLDSNDDTLTQAHQDLQNVTQHFSIS